MSGDHTSIASAEGYDAPGGGAQPGAAPAERDTPQRLRPSRWRPRPFAIVVLLVGLVVTAALTVPAELTYRHNERRLLNLQTRLTPPYSAPRRNRPRRSWPASSASPRSRQIPLGRSTTPSAP